MKPLTEEQLRYREKWDVEVLFYEPIFEVWYIGILRWVNHFSCRVYVGGVDYPYFNPEHQDIYESTPEHKLELLLNGERLMNG